MPNALTSLLPAGIGNALRQYLGDAFGGALNAEVKPQDTLDAAALSLTPVPVVGDVAGLLADGYRYATDPSSRTPLNYGLSALGALPFVPSMAGQIAWHGSPHKFDKFDLSKIGTGEGAQAYGHGLYLAENPGVAKSYSALAHYRTSSDKEGIALAKQKLQEAQSKYDELFKSFSPEKINSMSFDDISKLKETQDVFNAQDAYKKALTSEPQLYKTDIPDEAVARFLDWDKPLSEQAHVMDFINKQESSRTQSVLEKRLQTLSAIGENSINAETVKKQIAVLQDELANPMGSGLGSMTGGEYFNYLRRRDIDPQKQAEMFSGANIPGIRYLDGGSRGAGTGTSNFVVFDPSLIRILERNGQPTGLQPWAPGEWKGLLGNSVNKESPIRLISSQRFLDQDIVNDKIRKKDFSVKVSPVFELPDTGEKVRVVQDGHHALSAALESGNKPNILEQSVTQNDRIGLLNQGQIDDFLNASYHDSPWYYLDNGIDIW